MLLSQHRCFITHGSRLNTGGDISVPLVEAMLWFMEHTIKKSQFSLFVAAGFIYRFVLIQKLIAISFIIFISGIWCSVYRYLRSIRHYVTKQNWTTSLLLTQRVRVRSPVRSISWLRFSPGFSLTVRQISESLGSTAVELAVACAPVTQRARVRARSGQISWVRFFRGFSSPARQMSGSFRPTRSPYIILPS